MSENLEEVQTSLSRVQAFDPLTLARIGDLGRELNFQGAVEPARRVIGLFKQIPVGVLQEFPESELRRVGEQANAIFNHFKQCLEFSISGQPEGNVQATRDGIVSNIENAYQRVFSELHPLVSYASSRTVDFTRLEEQGRAAVQSIEDRADTLTESLQEKEGQAVAILQEVQKVAAEQGVSQQAIYFKDEADSHDEHAVIWMWAAIALGSLLAFMAAASVFLHKWDYLTPTTIYESIQLVATKILVFGTVGYMVVLSARNFLSHRHNAVVNRHRQNALMTFTALAEASGSDESQDIVLSHAAGCIFAPQPTGYTRGFSGQVSSSPGVTATEALPRILATRQAASE